MKNFKNYFKNRKIRLRRITVVVLVSFLSFFAVREIIKVFADSPVSTTWNFSNVNEYIAGDTGAAEILSGTAQLKVLEYSNDANTVSLFHMNEDSGSNPADSSSYNLTSSGNAISWNTGKLNGAIDFNGNISQVIVSDTGAISLTQSNTIEAWIKPDSAFHADNATGGLYRRMGIVDKGTYKIYMDSDTGKLVYELADATENLWDQVGGQKTDLTVTQGGWDLNGQPSVSSIVSSGNYIYVGLGSTAVAGGPGDAEVWRLDTTTNTWLKIGGDGTGVSPSTFGWLDGTYEEVTALTVNGDVVYAGLGVTASDAEVWKYESSQWTKIGGDGTGSTPSGSGWGSNYESVTGLIYLNNTLYASLGTSGAGDAEVWSWDGSQWSKIGGDSIGWGINNTSVYDGVFEFSTDGTDLYAGLGVTVGEAFVYKYHDGAWSLIGGSGAGNGWIAAGTYEAVYALEATSDGVWVGLGNQAGDADVYQYLYTTSSWSQIGGDGVGWGAGYETVYSMAVSGSEVYVGLGTTNNDAEVYRYSGGSWTKIGGDGINSGWSVANNYYWVRSLDFDSSGNLLAGVYQVGAATAGTGELWKWNGSSWTLLGGEYINDSWGYSGLNSIETLVQVEDKLYIGAGYTVNTSANMAGALMFEYDGSSINLIGGQGINSGWGSSTYAQNTHESIVSTAQYKGDLYVGLGTTTGDGEIWKWDDSKWIQVGGDGIGNILTGSYEAVNSMMVWNGSLYAGLGNSTGDGELWKYDDSSWTKIGGDQVGNSSPSPLGWITARFEKVMSMSVYQGNMVVGLGEGTGDADVWSYDGNNWTRIGGSGMGWNVSSSVDKETVNSLVVYKGDLYAGLGYNVAGDAEVWKYDGATWAKVGGDGDGDTTDSPTGWSDATYERVNSMAVYNGELFASLGYNAAGDGEVWKYNGSVWNRVGGDGSAGGWANSVVEEVKSLVVYKGKVYGGTGNTGSSDANLWSYGGNSILESTKNTWNSEWFHVAATYDGSTMKMFIDGELTNSASISNLFMEDTSTDLLIGTNYGERKVSGAQGYFDGLIDEVRISNTARTSFNTDPYSSDPQTISASSPAWGYAVGGIGSYVSFASTTNDTGTVTYRLSNDNASHWYWWDGDSWDVSDSTEESNSESEINDNISSFGVTDYGILWQAILEGDGDEQVKISNVTVTALDDTENPTPPTSVSTTFAVSGSQISPESFPDLDLDNSTWYNSSPTFLISGADDTGGAGIGGYWVYLGPNSSETPSMSGTFYSSTASSIAITADNLNSGSSYYLRIQTKDKAQRLSDVYAPLIYRFDNTPPTNPETVSNNATDKNYPKGDNEFTFYWPVPGDENAYDCKSAGGVIEDGINCSGIAGYVFKAGSGVYADWSSLTTETTITLSSAAYQENRNIFYLKAVDKAGNEQLTALQSDFYYAGSAPTIPQNLRVSPSEPSSTNSFSFYWDAPLSYSGEEGGLTYCYTINVKPSADRCPESVWTPAKSLAADAFANQPDLNTFNIVARDAAKNVNYDPYATIDFYTDTAAPGIPQTVEIADVSVKTTSSWKLATSWEPPEDYSGDLSYEVWHSDDGSTYEYEATTTGIAFVSTGLTQVAHYYKIKACDNTNNCGAFTTPVSMIPTGRYTSPPEILDDPEVTNITTKKATISWATDRTCDTKIQYGTSSDDYFDEEPSNSNQTTAHEISLDNLDPGTTYYFVAKWTDEDGNTGISEEFEFATEPAPTITDPSPKSIGISSVVLQYTVKDASKVQIYYGKTTAFGGLVELSTSVEETTYNTTIDELEDGTKYFYKINTFDTEDDEYEGNILSFETLPRPRIAGVKVQQVVGTAQPTVLVSWDTNTEVSSIVTYYPEGNVSAARDEVNVALTKGQHQILIRGLISQTPYALVVKGRDRAGNEASSEVQRFNTASDTRPPLIANLKVEGVIVSTADGGQTAQLVVSWDTDEGATSQIEFGEGTGTTYAQKSQEDSNLTFNHVVVLTGLTPSKVYHLRAISKDKIGNDGQSVDTVVITPKSSDSALNLVITNLQQVFGFLKNID